MTIEEPPEVSDDGTLKSVEAHIQAGKLFDVPSDEDFGTSEYLDAKDLEAVAQNCIASYPDKFGWLNKFVVLYFWKRKGGKSKGKRALGTTSPVKGLLHFETGAHYAIVIGADHIRELRFNNFQMDALMMHQLCYPVQDEDGNPSMRTTDVSEFAFVIQECGLWEQSLQDLGKAMRQLSFDDAGRL